MTPTRKMLKSVELSKKMYVYSELFKIKFRVNYEQWFSFNLVHVLKLFLENSLSSITNVRLGYVKAHLLATRKSRYLGILRHVS